MQTAERIAGQRRRSARWRVGGMTLLEVLAALVILSLLLAAAVSIQQRASRQWQQAQQNDLLLAEVDRLFANWYDDGGIGPPLNGGGEFSVDSQPIVWRVTPVSLPREGTFGLAVVRFEASSEDGELLLRLELPVHQPETKEPSKPVGAADQGQASTQANAVLQGGRRV